jgi:hypothetical protein
MAQRPTYDLLVAGADAAGLAAAAAAARLGASAVVVATGAEPRAAGLRPSPPNFVWRLLELHRYDLKASDAGRSVTYLADGQSIETRADPGKTARLLAARDPALEYGWPEFLEAMARARTAVPPQTDDRARGAAPGGLALAEQPSQSAVDVLDDRFADEGLKAHLLMTALAPLGLAGDEPGSARALFDIAAADPRERVDADALADALAAAAKDAGVAVETGKLVRLARESEKLWLATLDDEREIRAARAIASTAVGAEAAGLLIDAGGSPLRRQAGAEAAVRLRYARKPRLQSGESAGVHHIAPDKQALARARDAMLEGRIDDPMPLTFEIRGREILARAPFAPSAIRENGGMRDWTGQDLQILGRMTAAAIGRRLDPASGAPQAIDASLGPDVAAGLRKRAFTRGVLLAPAPCVDTVGAAAALAMALVRP